MKEVTKCSISGIAFTLDADAYEALRHYLDTLRTTYEDTPGGAEIVADIEARVAELILSAQDHARVVEKPLILNIIAQLGTPEDITEESADTPNSGEHTPNGEPRIPRRLYRDTENAKLGGVCAGIGRFFDIDPVWVRLGLFIPLILSLFGWIPFLYWTGPMMGNLFAIFAICYGVMWFVVPAARTARQKLEMTGERITAQSIRETTEANNDVDSKAKPIVAEAVSVFGKVVLICLKIFAGILVFALIMAACGLVIGLFALLVSGPDLLAPTLLRNLGLWLPVLGIFIALIPVIMLIYVFMCLIASRKPNGKAVLALFLLWLATIAACASMAIHQNAGQQIRRKRQAIERIMQTDVVINGDTTSVRQLLEDDDRIEAVLDKEAHTLRISVPDKQIDISVDKEKASVTVDNARPQKSVPADESLTD